MAAENKKVEDEHSRLSVRIGEFQVEIEGTHSNVASLMGQPLYDFIGQLQKLISEILPAEVSPNKVGSEEKPPSEYPPTLGKPSSLGDALKKLMVEKGWGRKPRTLSDIMTALETNGLYYEKAAVATTLVTLVKSGTLRRLGSRGNFQYVAA